MNAREVFSGGVAVITGAGCGIGAGIARHAVTLGMTVVLADVDANAIAVLRDELCATGASAVDVVCDVRDPDAVQELADRTYRDVGPVRLLVNNAGVEQFGYLWDTPVPNWRRVVDINISGVFYGVRAFLPKMIVSRRAGVGVEPVIGRWGGGDSLAGALHREQARGAGADRMFEAGR